MDFGRKYSMIYVDVVNVYGDYQLQSYVVFVGCVVESRSCLQIHRIVNFSYQLVVM